MRLSVSAVALILFFSLTAPLGAQTPVPTATTEPVVMTLDECIETGLDRNPQMAISEAQVDQAQAGVVQARSGKMPTVTLSANVVRSNKLMDFATSGFTMYPTGTNEPFLAPVHIHKLAFPGFEISSTREGDIYGVKVEAIYALYAGGMIKRGIETARLNVRATEEQVRQQENELVYNIEQAFFGVLLSQELVKLMDETYATYSARYRQLRDLYNEGLVANLDLLQVEAALAGIRSRQIEAHNTLEMAELGLKALMNLDLETPVIASGTLEYVPRELPLPDDLYAQAINDRPEMRVIRIRREMAEKLLEIAWGNALPTVGLFANYSWDRGQEMPPNDKIWRDGYQAGAALSVPLFDGLATQGKVEEAKAQLMQVEQGINALEVGIKTQVQQAVLAVRAAEERIEAEQANVDASQKNYDVARARYSVGLATNLDVMEAQTNLTAARMQYLAAVHDYNLAWTRLDAALGMPERRSR